MERFQKIWAPIAAIVGAVLLFLQLGQAFTGNRTLVTGLLILISLIAIGAGMWNYAFAPSVISGFPRYRYHWIAKSILVLILISVLVSATYVLTILGVVPDCCGFVITYSSNNIRLVPVDNQNIIVKLGSQTLSSGDVIPLNESIIVTFKILNNGTSPVKISALVIGSRGPGVNCENTNDEKWSAPDVPFATPRNITIQPGEEYEYRANRAFYLPGKYFLEPIIQDPNGNWGGIQPFSCISIAVDGTQSSQTETVLTPSNAPTPLLSTAVATIQSNANSPVKWCDSFDDGRIDENRWNLPTDPAIIYEENGKLNFRVIEDQSRTDEAWAGLEAKQTDKLIHEISYTVTLESYGEDNPGGVGIDVFLKDAEPVFSVDIGPGPDGPGGEFSFCPNFNAGYEECAHPTPVPSKAAFRVTVGSPIDIRVVGTGKDIVFNINNQPLAGQPVTAPIENFQFFIYADLGSTLHATIDNACVTYTSN